ncbi:hypothetical protein KEM55_004548 [Ascosphaera atra]|nr:hypothetical protein KEM55_004548 [Ascosphaera atra]
MSPIAFPVAVLLDKILGKGHGIVYKKAELKTLVYLHKSLGAAGEQLNSDEVTIISAVLDLKDKSVGSIMIPMEDVFTMSADSVLDEKMMDVILSQGYSRIPIHTPGNPGNFIGMLLVKMLITYDPEDCKQVKDFALATLPETRPETSCLDIVNFFQEGKSHMVLVSEYPGDDHGALGVVTLEDVIEELIGEEIIDESDVFIDVHKAIRRMAPAPKYRVPKGMFVPNFAPLKLAQVKASDDVSTPPISSPLRPTVSQDETTADSKPRFLTKPLAPIDAEGDQKQGGLSQSQIRKHLRHLGPSNPSSNPRQTRVQSVKIKPGPAEQASDYICPSAPLSEPIKPVDSEPNKAPLEFTRTTLLGQKVKGGARALRASYGALEEGSPLGSKESSPVRSFTKPKADIRSSDLLSSRSSGLLPDQRPSFAHSYPTGSSPMLDNSSLTTRSHPTKSGSITEQIVNVNGIRKVVLQPSSDHGSSDDNEASGNSNNGKTRSPRSEEERVESSPALEHLQSHLLLSDPEDNNGTNSSKRKRKRRRKRTGKARK